MTKTRVHLYISGIVQGISYRSYTRVKASQMNVTGWVRNLPDGRVEAVFEGETENVKAMVDWCRTGPPAARVKQVEVNDEPHTGQYRFFEILYGRKAVF